MLNFLWQIICFVWGAFLFFVSLLDDSTPARKRFADWDGEDGVDSSSGATMGRTCVGSVEPTMTSSRGESVGRMSGARINS